MIRLSSIALVLALAASACGEPAQESERHPQPIRVRCVGAAVASVARTRVLRGTVSPAPESDAVLAPLVGGVLARVPVREGDVVSAGQVVAEVDAQSLRDVLVEARAALAQARATGSSDAASLERERRLVSQGIAARHALELAEFADDHSRAGVAAAQASASIAARNVGRTQLRTPIAGVVLRVLRHVGELVDGTPATPVVEVADPASLELTVAASPSDLLVLARGQRGVARFDALGDQSWDVALRSFAPAVDPLTGLGVARFTFEPTNTARPPIGVFGAVEVQVGEEAGAVVVPAAALRNPSEAGAEVLVCEDGHAHVRAVTLGSRDAERVEILRGVSARDRVVVDDVVGVDDGTPIREIR